MIMKPYTVAEFCVVLRPGFFIFGQWTGQAILSLELSCLPKPPAKLKKPSLPDFWQKSMYKKSTV